ITLDGTSLTVVAVGDDWFNVTLVAYTQQHIIMPKKSVGDAVNIEVDVLGKYVERILQYRKPEAAESSVTREFLQENGYD
nr:riboflavin synthase [Granulosicoccus sp.]